MKEAFLSLEINYKKLIYTIPLFFFFGNWIISSVIVSFIFLFFLFETDKDKLGKTHIPKLFIWIMLLIWGVYVIAISPDKSEAIKYYYYLFIIPFLLFIIINSIELDLEFLSTIVNILIIVAAALSIISIFIFINSGFNLKTKITAVWENYNIISAFLMIVLMFNLSILFNAGGRKQLVLYIFSGSIILFGIFLTQTRGVWLSIILSLLFYVIKKPKFFAPAIIIMSVVITMLTIFFPEVIAERFLSVKYFGSDVSSLGRLQAWLSSIELIRMNPLFGYGFNSYIYLRDQVFGFYFVLVEHSHNTYLRAILEMGLIGFCLYFFYFFLSVYYTFKLLKSDKQNRYRIYLDGLQLSFIGLIISFMFEPYLSLFGVSSVAIWLLISITFNIKSNQKIYFKPS